MTRDREDKFGTMGASATATAMENTLVCYFDAFREFWCDLHIRHEMQWIGTVVS